MTSNIRIQNRDGQLLNSEECIRHLKSFHQARILCIGDVKLDHFVQVTISAESNSIIPILRYQSQTSSLGGAGNVFKILAHLQAKCYLISVIGGNDSGHISKLCDELPNNSGANVKLIKDQHRRTTEVTRFSSGQQRYFRFDQDDLTPLTSDIEDLVIHSARQLFPSIDVIIFSDYGRGVLTPRILQTLLVEARTAGILTLVDPSGKCMDKYNGAYLVKPNRRELCAMMDNLPTDTIEGIIMAGNECKKKYRFDNILVTGDNAGMVFMDNKELILIEPSHAQLVVDELGGGDTVIATMAVGLALKIPLQMALHLASRSAGIAVAKADTEPVTLQELQASFLHK